MAKLRVSLTDRCNYRCVYCMPECVAWKPRDQMLSLEELYSLVELFVRHLGIEQIRLTGGEPLMRHGVAEFVRMLGGLRAAGLRRVSLSTNGVLLDRFAGPLAQAGLDDVNVSLDSLSPERFAHLTGGGDVRDVLRGIDSARAAGLPVKINAVVIRGCNETGIIPLAQWATREELPLRFIEFMPLDGRGIWSPDKVFSEKEIIAVLAQRFDVAALPRTGNPAAYFLLDSKFPVGIISTVSNPFCARCDRVRLTADGRLFSCLFSPAGADLRGPLRCGQNAEALAERVCAAMLRKPPGFIALREPRQREVSMNVLGG